MFPNAFDPRHPMIPTGTSFGELIARDRARAAIQNAMQSPDGIREQVTKAADPASVAAQIRHSALTGPIPGLRPFIIALALTLFSVCSALAQCPRCGQFHPPYDRQPVRNALQAAGNVVQGAMSFLRGNDALDEVNAARARRGLRPFLPDPLLTQGAMACAEARAARRIRGHLPNDFGYLPLGARASSAGCAAWEPSWGWGACCTYDRYTYAGAAWAMGSDGKRYMHLFVR